MGSSTSKESSPRRYPHPAMRDQYNNPYPQQAPGYYSPSKSFDDGPPQAPPPRPQKNLAKRSSKKSNDFQTLYQVTKALAKAGLKSSNLIVGIDFTKSNEWTGSRSFNRRSLHHIGEDPNPYEEAISIIGKTLHSSDKDYLIPSFGFGDASTRDEDVFSFHPNDQHCNGFEEVLTRYREIVPNLKLAGPTSFGPIIEMATTIVKQSGSQYHVLLIIADGLVTRSVDTRSGHLSVQEENTIDAIFRAREYPLSIVLVGVGDEPWGRWRDFNPFIPGLKNFHFVNFTEVMSKNNDPFARQAEFAKSALMGLPSQYKAFLKLGMLGRKDGASPNGVPLQPPNNNALLNGSAETRRSISFRRITAHNSFKEPEENTSSHSSSSNGYQDCPICLTLPKDMAFGCGHRTCCDCGEQLELCPICRTPIKIRIRLY